MLTKMVAVLKFALVALSLIEVSTGFQWTSSKVVPNNSTIAACVGQDLSILWSYTNRHNESIQEVEWRYQPTDGSPMVVLATEIRGHFFSDAIGQASLKYLPNAGIRLVNIAAANSGTYSVRVIMNLHGSFVTQEQSVNVAVTAVPVTTDNNLHAQFEGAMFINSTQQHHLIVSCGEFSPVWIPSTEVVWTTPMNQTVASTFIENGRFALAVPNPFISGEYTCRIPSSAAVSVCISSASSLSRGATVAVGGVEGRISLIDSEMKLMQKENALMATDIQTLKRENALLTSEVQTLRNEKSDMNSTFQSLQNINSTIQYLLGTGIRLVNGTSNTNGRVEIILNGVWGTVCDDGWDTTDAMVVCRQLGYRYSGAQALSHGQHNFGEGTGPIYRDEVQCMDNDPGLQYCRGSPVGRNDCTHSEDAGVICQCKY